MEKWYGGGAAVGRNTSRKKKKRKEQQWSIPPAVAEVMAQDFVGSTDPFSTPWVSLWLGRRGLEVAEAVHGADVTEGADHTRAVQDFSSQWLHFLHTEFLPEYAARVDRSSTSHKQCHDRVDKIVFSGAIVGHNWLDMKGVLCPDGAVANGGRRAGGGAGECAAGGNTSIAAAGGNTSIPAAGDNTSIAAAGGGSGVKAGASVRVECAPAHAALLGAAKYALGGGKHATDIWSAKP
jgi:hypothetical protein